MTIRNITTDQQIAAVEQAIRDTKEAYGEERQPMIAALASIAKDIQARRPGAPSLALHELTRRLTAVERSRTALGYSHGAMQGVAEELIGRWAVVKAALELFGAMVESGHDPLEDGFRIGFEHAVAGGEEAGRSIHRAHMPLVLYFENEDDRREMIDAIQLAKPGMTVIKIPERRSPK